MKALGQCMSRWSNLHLGIKNKTENYLYLVFHFEISNNPIFILKIEKTKQETTLKVNGNLELRKDARFSNLTLPECISWHNHCRYLVILMQ